MKDEIFIEGYYFYILGKSESGQDYLMRQGQVMKSNKDNTMFLCDFFEWILGEHMFSEIVDIDFLKTNCIMFKDTDQRDAFFEKHKDTLVASA